jgi:Ala-tRNA(Pro) deacylase
MTNLFAFLETSGIAYDRHDHPPVFTVDDVNRLTPDLPGAKTKNLFFRDQKGTRHFLVVVPADKRVDLKKLPQALGVKRVSFGSPDRLKKYLGIEPGAVSLLAIINDAKKAVELLVDKALWEADAFQFHPLVNTSTLVITKAGIVSFAEAAGHAITVMDVPAQP